MLFLRSLRKNTLRHAQIEGQNTAFYRGNTKVSVDFLAGEISPDE